MTKDVSVSEAEIEAACRAVAADHYSRRFNKSPHDPHVVTNVDANWSMFMREMRIALQAYAALRSNLKEQEPVAAEHADLRAAAERAVEFLAMEYDEDARGLVDQLERALASPTSPVSREAVVEECARVADALVQHRPKGFTEDAGTIWPYGGEEIPVAPSKVAAAIRSLSPTDKETGK